MSKRGLLFGACLVLSSLAPVFEATANEPAAPVVTTQALLPPPVPDPALSAPPKLIIAISVDQFSANLFGQYRQQFDKPVFTRTVNGQPRKFSGGFAVLTKGAVFSSGYQAHAATETCPGHSTILTGMRPAHTGIVANNWFAPGGAKLKIYCAEDEAQPPVQGGFVPSPIHLLVPTLGEMLKSANSLSRNVAVSGKDRAALMMGGKQTDAAYWWGGSEFRTFDGKPVSPAVGVQNALVYSQLSRPFAGYAPGPCSSLERAVESGQTTIGTGRFAAPQQDTNAYRISPRLDAATLDLAWRLIQEQSLGQDPVPDVLSVSLSATDYVGHAYGNEGPEMCIQMAQLNYALGLFIDKLKVAKIDYAIVLTADHGGFDAPERAAQQGIPGARRALAALLPENLGDTIATTLTLNVPRLLYGDGPAGDYYINASVTGSKRAAVIAEAKKLPATNDQVAAVFSAAEIIATPMPSGSPEAWSLIERARASYYPGRSGDFVVLLKPFVVAQTEGKPGYVATHGSPWDYDRRVPILFYRPGMAGFEQAAPVETVDIVPTLLPLVKLGGRFGAFDGRCLDIDAGRYNLCTGN